jgi:TPR repeat protein
MATSPSYAKATRKSKNADLFLRAEQQEDKGKFRSAFRLYLAAAKAGDRGSQLNVGNYYDGGKGVRQNRAAAMYWFKRAYRRGDCSAAHNIGVMWRNDQKFKRALAWFERAVKLGDDESNLEIAKHYLRNEHKPDKAIPYLKKVRNPNWVSEAGAEEASKLLKETQRLIKRTRARSGR